MFPLAREECVKLIGFIEEDLAGAVITSSNINVSPRGKITVEEIVLRLPNRSEIAIGLRTGETDQGIIIDTYDSPRRRRPGQFSGWRELTIKDDYAEDLAELRLGTDEAPAEGCLS